MSLRQRSSHTARIPGKRAFSTIPSIHTIVYFRMPKKTCAHNLAASTAGWLDDDTRACCYRKPPGPPSAHFLIAPLALPPHRASHARPSTLGITAIAPASCVRVIMFTVHTEPPVNSPHIAPGGRRRHVCTCAARGCQACCCRRAAVRQLYDACLLCVLGAGGRRERERGQGCAASVVTEKTRRDCRQICDTNPTGYLRRYIQYDKLVDPWCQVPENVGSRDRSRSPPLVPVARSYRVLVLDDVGSPRVGLSGNKAHDRRLKDQQRGFTLYPAAAHRDRFSRGSWTLWAARRKKKQFSHTSLTHHTRHPYFTQATARTAK